MLPRRPLRFERPGTNIGLSSMIRTLAFRIGRDSAGPDGDRGLWLPQNLCCASIKKWDYQAELANLFYVGPSLKRQRMHSGNRIGSLCASLGILNWDEAYSLKARHYAVLEPAKWVCIP